ncbi:MAG TPA: hypothetical protein VE225_07765 [Rubrobacteraceae bacterium]|nr:hypothetical protein [Rubrobacteraceae bacterium]
MADKAHSEEEARGFRPKIGEDAKRLFEAGLEERPSATSPRGASS